MNVASLMEWLEGLNPTMEVYITPDLECRYELKEAYLGVYNEVLLSGMTNEEYEEKRR